MREGEGEGRRVSQPCSALLLPRQPRPNVPPPSPLSFLAKESITGKPAHSLALALLLGSHDSGEEGESSTLEKRGDLLDVCGRADDSGELGESSGDLGVGGSELLVSRDDLDVCERKVSSCFSKKGRRDRK